MSTQLIEHTGEQPTQFSYVRDGIAGNFDVIAKMTSLVRNSLILDKGLEDFFKQTLAANDLDSHSAPDDIFRFIYNFVRNHIAYIQDVGGSVESIKSARVTINDGYGDCDDQSVLVATWLASLGYEPNFVIAKYDADTTANFQHVYCSVDVNGTRFVFDTILPNGQLNDEVDATQIAEINIFDFNPALDGFSGTVNGVKNLIKDTARNGVSAINTFAGFLPIGLIPAHALQFGSALFKGVETEPTINAKGSQVNGVLTDVIIQLQQGVVSRQIAQARARKAVADFYASYLSLRQDNANVDKIFDLIEQKFEYIENYGATPNTQGFVDLNINYMAIAGIAAVGIGAYFFFSNK